MKDLKPFPFCGGKAFVRYIMPCSEVQCSKCGASTSVYSDDYEEADSRPKAIEAWNNRSENWIDAKNELPIPHDAVLAITDYGGYLMAHVGFNGEWLDDDDSLLEDTITHWMPLPDYPKQKES